jgi:type IV secretion system protein TrbL
MSCGITDPLGCVAELAGGAAKQIAGSAFSEIAHDFGQAADSAINWLWGQTSAATSVTLGGAGWKTDLGITAALAASIGLGLFVIQLIVATVRREPGGLARAGRGLVVAFVAGGAAIAITNLLLGASDAVSAGIVQVGTGTSIEGMGRELLGATALVSISNPAIVIVVALGMIAATVVVWFALMIRKLLIIVAAVFAPVAFTGALSDITTNWVRKWIEMMIALIASKIILVTIFVVGLGVLETGVGETRHAGAGHTLTQVVVGVLILLMAGFAPWLAIKLVHFAGDSFHVIHASAGSVTQGAQTAIAAPQKLVSVGRRASNSVSSSKSSQSSWDAGATSDSNIGGGASFGGGRSGTSGPAGVGSGSAGGAVAAAGPIAAAGVAGGTVKGAVDSINAKVADTASRTSSRLPSHSTTELPTPQQPAGSSSTGRSSRGRTRPPASPPRAR